MARRPPPPVKQLYKMCFCGRLRLRAGRRAQLHGRRGRPDVAQKRTFCSFADLGVVHVAILARAYACGARVSRARRARAGKISTSEILVLITWQHLVLITNIFQSPNICSTMRNSGKLA